MILRIPIPRRHSRENGNTQVDSLMPVAASPMRFSTILLAAALSIWLLAACDTEGPASIREGNQAFEAGEYQQAWEAYDRALDAMPQNPEATYNSANALYRQELYGEAINSYDNGIETALAELSQKAAFNAGNSLYQSESYEEAVESYKQALRLDPGDDDAKHNLELALRRIEERNRQEQQDQQQQEGQEQEQEEEEDGQQQTPGQAPQEQEPQPQDQQPPQDDSEQDSQQDEPSEETDPEEGESNSTQSPSDPGEVPPTGMTEEQAERLLESVADNTETLRGRIMQGDILPETVEREW